MDTLTEDQISALKNSYSSIPNEYLDWLSTVGWGEHENGYMFYSGPSYSVEIFGSDIPANIHSVLLIGDDMAGYSIGFDKSGQFVGIDSNDWELDVISEGLNAYIKS